MIGLEAAKIEIADAMDYLDAGIDEYTAGRVVFDDLVLRIANLKAAMLALIDEPEPDDGWVEPARDIALSTPESTGLSTDPDPPGDQDHH